MNINMKSAVCGFAAGVGITLALGASTTSTGPGRFQVTGAANYLAVIDTQTGKVWAGNFNQLGPGAQGLDFRICPQSGGEFFKEKID